MRDLSRRQRFAVVHAQRFVGRVPAVSALNGIPVRLNADRLGLFVDLERYCRGCAGLYRLRGDIADALTFDRWADQLVSIIAEANAVHRAREAWKGAQ